MEKKRTPSLSQITLLYGMVFRKDNVNEAEGNTANGVHSLADAPRTDKPEILPAQDCAMAKGKTVRNIIHKSKTNAHDEFIR